MVLRSSYSIAAAYGEDAIMLPEGPLALPGKYQVRLTVGGRTYTAPLELKMDPRVPFSAAALEQQLTLQKQIVNGLNESLDLIRELREAHRQLIDLRDKTENNPSLAQIAEAVKAFDTATTTLLGGPPQFPPSPEPTVSALHNGLTSLMVALDGADTAPTAEAAATYQTYSRLLAEQMKKWSGLKEKELSALNNQLRAHNLPPIDPRNR